MNVPYEEAYNERSTWIKKLPVKANGKFIRDDDDKSNKRYCYPN